MKAIKISNFGDADVLKLTDAEPKPLLGPGQVLVKIHAAGVNFVDIYHRRGTYPQKLPFVPGLEASGVVEEVGDEVLDFHAGDRVAYTGHIGSYSEPQQTAVTVSVWIVVGVLIGSLAWDHYALWLTIPMIGLIIDWFSSRWLRGVIFWPLLIIALIAINLPIPYQAALYASLGPIGSSLSTWGMVLLLAVMNYRVWRIAQERIEQPIAEDGLRANHAESATSIE